MRRNRRTLLLFALAATLALALAACGTGGREVSEGGGGAVAAGQADTPRISVAMITHAAPGDTFWDLVREGAQTAADKDNVELIYSSEPSAPGQARLVQNAIDQNVAGIAVTLAYPDAMAGAVQTAIDAGIPVVAFNSGLEDWQDAGAMMYFGQDENLAGQAAGERLNELGAQHVVCVIQEQGHVALEARCAGVEETFVGQTEILYVTGTDMPSVRSTITASLQQDPSIDYVLTLGAPFALTAVQAVQSAGSEAQVATFDVNQELLQAIQAGDVQWAIDQQPFVQGYLAVDSLWLFLLNGSTIGGGQPVLTGPAFVTPENVDAYLE